MCSRSFAQQLKKNGVCGKVDSNFTTVYVEAMTHNLN